MRIAGPVDTEQRVAVRARRACQLGGARLRSGVTVSWAGRVFGRLGGGGAALTAELREVRRLEQLQRREVDLGAAQRRIEGHEALRAQEDAQLVLAVEPRLLAPLPCLRPAPHLALDDLAADVAAATPGRMSAVGRHPRRHEAPQANRHAKSILCEVARGASQAGRQAGRGGGAVPSPPAAWFGGTPATPAPRARGPPPPRPAARAAQAAAQNGTVIESRWSQFASECQRL
jgi:hypothetical protein